MKYKNVYSLFLILFALSFYACDDEDIFEGDPDSTVVDDFFQTQNDFTLAIRGAYNQMKLTGYYGGSGLSGDLIVVGDLLSDNLITNPRGRQTNLQSHNWLYNGNTTPSIMYERAYRGISRANSVLDNIDNLPDGAFKNQIRAEALALRASLHFDVARFYAKIPTQSADANSSLGIVYSETLDPTNSPVRLETVQETYAKINADIELAVSLIGSTTQTEIGRLDANSIRGLASRIALHQGDYDKVISYGASVANGLAPANASDLAGLWTSANSAGVLFELPFIVSDPLLDTNYSQGSGNALLPEWSVDKDFYDTYDQSTEPERIAAYFLELTNTDLNETWFLVNKYINGNLQTGLNNGRYLRVEEVILNVAEAYYMNNNEPLALQMLNKLRDVRYSSYTGGESGDALFDAIMLERRKELAFESSDRWFTLKRLQNVSGIPSSYKQGVQRTGNGHLADGGGVVPSNLTLPAGDFKWQLPMQQTWLNENGNLEQNPDY